MDYPLWKNPDSLTFLESKKAFFPSYHIFKHVFQSDFDKNKNVEKFQIFDQNQTNPFGKIPILQLFWLSDFRV